MSGRGLKVSRMIQKELGDILAKELHDPRIGFVTITSVTMHDDLKIATVHFRVLSTQNHPIEETIQGLNNAAGYIRKLIGQRVHLKAIPKIVFEYDYGYEHEANLNRIFEQIDNERAKGNETTESSD